AEYLGAHGTETGRELFAALPEYQALAQKEPDSAASLLNQFSVENAVERRHRLYGIPRDAPIHEWQEVQLLRMPALVIGNEPDYVHPWSYAAAWAEHLPCARLVKAPPRHSEFPAHAAAVRRNLVALLEGMNRNTKETPCQ